MESNYKHWSTTTFNYAYVKLPTGEIIGGKCQNWTDIKDKDQLQVTIDNVTHFSAAENIVLVYDPSLDKKYYY